MSKKRKAVRKALKEGGHDGHSQYLPIYALQVEEVAKLGATKADIAKVFHVTPRIIHEWGKKHPEFREAIVRGRSDPDNKVERSLFRRALAGDVKACIYWLSNRRPDKWALAPRWAQPPAPTGDNPTADQIRSMPSDKLRRLLSGSPPSNGEAKVIDLVPVPAALNGNGKH